MRTPSFYSDPHVQFLSQLLDEIESGLLQVPRFQRPFVWNWERRRELLRSIRDGIPIGAVMVWRTAVTSVECYSRLGPYELSSPPKSGTRSYLLDGVQRLTTLYGALHLPNRIAPDVVDAEGDELDDVDGPDEVAPNGGFEVFVDLAKLDFCIPELDDVSGMMPLNLVFDSVALLQFQRVLSLGGGGDKLIRASDEIASAFRDCKIPMIPISTDDVDMATRTFQRINSQGAAMSEAHMVHALTWSADFDLRRRMSDLSKEYLQPIGWGSLDEDPMLKAIKASFGLDVYKTGAQELSDSLRKKPSAVEEVIAATSRAAEFLWKHCGVPSADLVPYALQIVVLTEAFRVDPEPSDENIQNLHAWFWVTTYGELFAGMSGDRVQLALGDMRQMLSSGVPTWTWRRPYEDRPLAKSFDFRAARAKAMVFRLADIQNKLVGAGAGSTLLAESGRRAVSQLLPWSRSARSAFSSPANRFLVSPVYASTLKERMLAGDLSDLEEAIHLVDGDARRFLLGGQIAEFVSSRLSKVDDLERQFVEPLLGRFGVPGVPLRPPMAPK